MLSQHPVRNIKEVEKTQGRFAVNCDLLIACLWCCAISSFVALPQKSNDTKTCFFDTVVSCTFIGFPVRFSPRINLDMHFRPPFCQLRSHLSRFVLLVLSDNKSDSVYNLLERNSENECSCFLSEYALIQASIFLSFKQHFKESQFIPFFSHRDKFSSRVIGVEQFQHFVYISPKLRSQIYHRHISGRK